MSIFNQGIPQKMSSTDFDQPFEVHRDIVKSTVSANNINVAISIAPDAHPAIGGINKQWVKGGAAMCFIRLFAADAENNILAKTLTFKLWAFPGSGIDDAKDPQSINRQQGTGLLLLETTVIMGGVPLIADKNPFTGAVEASTDFSEMESATDAFNIDTDICHWINNNAADDLAMLLRIDMTVFHGLYLEPTAAADITRILAGVGRMM